MKTICKNCKSEDIRQSFSILLNPNRMSFPIVDKDILSVFLLKEALQSLIAEDYYWCNECEEETEAEEIQEEANDGNAN